jgi:hypothetical protein
MSIEVKLEIYVRCSECGRELEARIWTDQNGYTEMNVAPCKNCIRDAEGQERPQMPNRVPPPPIPRRTG